MKTSILLISMLGAQMLLGAPPSRIKELAAVEGVRDNQLLGYGLVVGLKGTGDMRQTFFSAQTLTNLLERMGVQVNPTMILVRNTAAVMVTANLPPFARSGSRIDVQVAAIGDAWNLQGGLLVLTPLRAADGRVFAVAQGPVVTGGFVASGGFGNTTTVNHPTAGRIPSGAIVEQAAPSVMPEDQIRLQLHEADFTTAARMAEAINKQFGEEIASCETAGSLQLNVPASYAGRTVQFIAAVESITLDVDRRARIVINERTGTIAMGKDVRIRPAAIMHGNLSVEVQRAFNVSQPNPLADGRTVVVPEVNVGVNEESARHILLGEGTTVDELVKALTAIGSTARDVIVILQNLKAAGALDAELEII
jgi:flagellar P-ring protein FlgI